MEKTQTPVKNTSHFKVAAISAGIVLGVLLLIWIPFKLIPAIFANGSSYVATTLSSQFIPSDNTADATSTVTTTNTVSTTNTQNTSATTVKKAYVPASYYGSPDLAISLVATGIIDPATRQFYQTSYAGGNDEIAVRFEVRNIGTNVTGPWRLRLNMPSRTTPYYDSDYQPSIKPGDRMLFTASFDSPVNQGINTAYITADPLNGVIESNEANNALTVALKVEGLSYSYNTAYNYGTTNGTVSYTWTNINANCYTNTQTAYQGNPITWYASVSGGNGYFTYYWAGSDGMFSTDSSVTRTYYTPGLKTATVNITSGGQTVTKQCSVYVY